MKALTEKNIGSVLYVEEGPFWMIGRIISIDYSHSAHKTGTANLISQEERVSKEESWCYSDVRRSYRFATEEEITYLNFCLSENKFFTKEEFLVFKEPLIWN